MLQYVVATNWAVQKATICSVSIVFETITVSQGILGHFIQIRVTRPMATRAALHKSCQVIDCVHAHSQDGHVSRGSSTSVANIHSMNHYERARITICMKMYVINWQAMQVCSGVTCSLTQHTCVEQQRMRESEVAELARAGPLLYGLGTWKQVKFILDVYPFKICYRKYVKQV